tara:strand:- start:654 stop:938 length:285 start_codon:yes stop_codon:yes gene_type:complete
MSVFVVFPYSVRVYLLGLNDLAGLINEAYTLLQYFYILLLYMAKIKSPIDKMRMKLKKDNKNKIQKIEKKDNEEKEEEEKKIIPKELIIYQHSY